MPNKQRNSSESITSFDESIGGQQTPIERGIYTSAFLCAYLLQEGSDGPISAVRLVDTFEPNYVVNPDTHTVLLPPVYTQLVVIFKSDKPQRFAVTVIIQYPSGKSTPPKHFEANIKSQREGQILKIDVTLDPMQTGSYWAEVFVEDVIATRVPFFILPAKSVPSEQQS